MYLEIIFRLMGKLQEKPRNSYKPFFQTHSCFLSYSCYSLPLYMLTYTHIEHFSFLHLLTVVCSSLYHAIFFWIYIGYPRFVSCPSNVLSSQKWVSFPPLCSSGRILSLKTSVKASVKALSLTTWHFWRGHAVYLVAALKCGFASVSSSLDSGCAFGK